MMKRKRIAVLDFGSQYAHLIAKRLRLQGFYAEIERPSAPLDAFDGAAGIIMSGGPSSVYDEHVPQFNRDILSLDVPVLGLCYGHQLMASCYGGAVEQAAVGEFGFAQLEKTAAGDSCPLFDGVPFPAQVWMSHQDAVTKLPEGFEAVAATRDCAYAAVQDLRRRRFGFQFHAEVKDTPCGAALFANFARFCGMEQNWDQDTVLSVILENIRRDAGDKKVLLFLSGGVDSTVAFALLTRALGEERVLGLHIDNGFMRKNESAKIEERYRAAGFSHFIVEDASESFLRAVDHLTDPQKKRMAVGEHFITVRDEVVSRLHLDETEWLLAQGTLYPDIIESGGTENAHTIKTHHNRVAGIQSLIEKGLIIEPLKDLYKDEVRVIGTKLGLDRDLIMRHPFPGPGLSINVLCRSAEEKTDESELQSARAALDGLGLREIDGYSAALGVLPVKSVGVQGDFRTYRFPAVLSFAADTDGFSCAFPGWDALEKTSSHITNAAAAVNRTVLTLYVRPGVSLAVQEGYCDRRRLDQTREADAIMLDALHASGWYDRIFQHLTINLPFASSADHCSIVLRPVVSEDVMTARFAHLDRTLLCTVVRAIAALPYVDAVYYDITNKPPATFGWE